MENIEKIIKERHSVRSYLDKAIEEDKVNVLNELINNINKENNLNIQLILNDNEVFDKYILHYGRLKNCKNYLAMIGKKDDLLDEKIGYNGEKIVLLAQELVFLLFRNLFLPICLLLWFFRHSIWAAIMPLL